MPLQIKTRRMKELIFAYKRKQETLKVNYQNQVDWGEMTETQMILYLAEDIAILKILEEVAAKKTTSIKVEQIKLF